MKERPSICIVGADASDGCAVLEQDFGRHNRPGKLKTWKPDMLHGVTARQNSSFSGFQIFTRITGTGDGIPATDPGPTLKRSSSWPL